MEVFQKKTELDHSYWRSRWTRSSTLFSWVSSMFPPFSSVPSSWILGEKSFSTWKLFFWVVSSNSGQLHSIWKYSWSLFHSWITESPDDKIILFSYLGIALHMLINLYEAIMVRLGIVWRNCEFLQILDIYVDVRYELNNIIRDDLLLRIFHQYIQPRFLDHDWWAPDVDERPDRPILWRCLLTSGQNNINTK